MSGVHEPGYLEGALGVALESGRAVLSSRRVGHSFPTGELGPDPEDRDRLIPVVQQKATTCDLCHDLGPGAEPSCVYACPHDAAHRMSGHDLIGKVEKRMGR